MSNIIDSIQLSGVTYTLQGSGGGITSGDVQTMIDDSISGKVNTTDNVASGITLHNELLTSITYSYGEINDFWIGNPKWDGNFYVYFRVIISEYAQYRWYLRVEVSNGGITSVRSTSGNFDYEIVDGKVHVTLDEGYSFYQAQSNSSLKFYYISTYSGGQSAQVLNTSVNEALSDINDKIVEDALTGSSFNVDYNQGRLYIQGERKKGYPSSSSIKFYDDKTIHYNENSGLNVNFSASTSYTEVLNVGSGNYCMVPQYNPSYDNSFEQMTVKFNSGYIGSNETFNVSIGLYYFVGNDELTQEESYIYNVTANTLTFNNGSGMCDVVQDGYDFTFTPKDQYPNWKVRYVRDDNCSIAAINNVDYRDQYIITGVTAPTNNYNGQDIIDDIYTKIGGKQNILSAGTGIEISGNVISATGGGGTVSSAITSGDTNAVAGGAVYDKFDEVEQVTARALNDLDEKINPTVELTQAEYDALVTAGTVASDTYYIITDATPVDVSQYWTSAQTQSAINQATSGKVNTSSVVSSVTSASTDSEIPTAKAVWEAASGGTGGGKAIEAGRGISVTTGETADTVSFNLPISAGTDVYSVKGGYESSANTYSISYGIRTKAIGNCSAAFGDGAKARGNYSFAGNKGDSIGAYSCSFNEGVASNRSSFAEGYNTQSKGTGSHSEGMYTTASTDGSHTEGYETIVKNVYEHSSGKHNNSVSASTTFGDSGNTLFSVGNGTSNNARHNAFEIRQNGDIYLSSGGTDIKLQDHLGGTASSAITSGDTNAVAGGAVYAKLDEMEQVIARALNDLNARITAIENQLNSNNS